MKWLTTRSRQQTEFHQAVLEVAKTIVPYINQHPQYEETSILERLTEPDRVISFRVCWEDDEGGIQVNRGYRVQFNNAIGPYKGGLRFDPSVNLSILKFLAFEQTFKNSLTTLPMGSAKGGADFNPKGRSDREVMRFCQSYMTELFRHIGKNVDVPAGDIGVGAREISYLFGQYKRIANQFTGTLTGKGLSFGGSLIRTEATGYGTIYFAREMFAHRGDSLEGKTAVVSGSGNVAQFATEKLIQEGAKVLTLSDRNGFFHDPQGITREKLDFIMRLKNKARGSLEEYAREYKCEWHEGKRPWAVPCDMAFPCATQNELDETDAATLVNNGCKLVAEGANMPSTIKAIEVFRASPVLFGPGKAANAGGVAVSGLEMTQNSMRLTWTRAEVDQELQKIMHRIHQKCVEYGASEDGSSVNYVSGANLAGFVKVADAMLAFGVC